MTGLYVLIIFIADISSNFNLPRLKSQGSNSTKEHLKKNTHYIARCYLHRFVLRFEKKSLIDTCTRNASPGILTSLKAVFFAIKISFVNLLNHRSFAKLFHIIKNPIGS